MSDFNITYQKIISNEGGYSPAFGMSGETYKGIDRKYFPSWQGWQMVDAVKPLRNGAIINNADLENYVKDFYMDYLGKLCNLPAINNQTLADFTGDFLIHKLYDCVKVINVTAQHLNPLVPISFTEVTDDVIALMNQLTTQFYSAFYNNRVAYYENPGTFGSKYKKFSPGIITAFINRVRTFPAAIL